MYGITLHCLMKNSENYLKCHIKFVKSTEVVHYFAEAIASSIVPWVSVNILLWNIMCALNCPYPNPWFSLPLTSDFVPTSWWLPVLLWLNQGVILDSVVWMESSSHPPRLVIGASCILSCLCGGVVLWGWNLASWISILSLTCSCWVSVVPMQPAKLNVTHSNL